ncbi:beta-barrel assembly machinery complex, BamA/YaeT protein [Campylobacter subantarcticus LMG 24377]|uniref:Outer membrane protein assembly factor BamA n=2 Tax=Campylobacter subantarcticus TaxID=497724 RepID=A0A0A8HB34_9BACT|nr:outer membrane protein assembly factor BamA [Campylobacter subantarcticus]EAJ1261324.1 outer membrane protein assembly factor BamA [Campylobacter lari]AJC90119.1 beta-barrel assembly machinery complex, BamA/YaeT protein [Campylobacter subantarcticus LMG 24374]AJC91786.1 beta-barrel assembly machinery complex, BamA/YaeT protein [Campylobacter subantarcticus LMG 24377]EAL3939234.1 outer membrane protein assembly factor BamA [Campylobacter lari]MPC00115.1 outer membrane protein assembly factor
MKKWFVFFALSSSLCAATIKDIKFEGLSQLSKESAIAISKLKIGQKIDPASIDIAIKNLFNRNYFKDIVVEEENGVLTFKVVEKPSIGKIDIQGIASNDRKQIESLVGLKPGILYDENSAKDAAEKIKLFYQAKGFYDTVVEIKDEKLSNSSSLKLTFVINRGENIIIEKVHLSGAKNLSYSDIEPAIANKQREALGWMWGFNDGKLKIFDLANDSSRISDVYLKEGYLDVSISPAFLNTYTDTYQADLTYFINEGEVYKVKGIKIFNPIFSDEENEALANDLKLNVGKIVNIEKLREDIKTIEIKTADLGYAFVQVIPDIQKDRENHEAMIIFKVIPNEKVYIRDVIISGNTKTVDRVIRRELYLTEGNLYNRTDLIDSRNALRRTAYFENVDIKEQRVDDTHIDLIVEVKEASTGAISGGIGYGTSDGILLSASLSDANILGSGMKGNVSIDKGDDTLSGRVSLRNPRVNDSDYSLGGSLYSDRLEWDSYDERNYGFNISVGKTLGRYTSIDLTYNLEQSDIYHLSDRLIAQGYKLGKTYKSSITPSIVFNNTDDYYLPRSGFIASTSLEYAGLGGDQEFISSTTKFNYYQGLEEFIGWDLIYRYKASFYKVWDQGYLPINEKLYLGGIGTIRGFDRRSVSPKNEWGDETGGTVAFANSVELSFPIFDRIKLRGSVFFDYGAIGESSLSQIQRWSTGVGFEWLTPLGALNLVFAKPFNTSSKDDLSKFEFMLGARF